MIKKILFVSVKIAGVTRVMFFFMFIVLRVPYQPVVLYAPFEYLYARYRLSYNHMQAYLYKCTEQETYLHQEDLNYLLTRKRF